MSILVTNFAGARVNHGHVHTQQARNTGWDFFFVFVAKQKESQMTVIVSSAARWSQGFWWWHDFLCWLCLDTWVISQMEIFKVLNNSDKSRLIFTQKVCVNEPLFHQKNNELGQKEKKMNDFISLLSLISSPFNLFWQNLQQHPNFWFWGIMKNFKIPNPKKLWFH